MDLPCIVFSKMLFQNGLSKMLITSGSVCWVKNIVPAAGYPTGKLLTVERITFPQEGHLVTGKWLILEWNEPSASDREVFLLTHVLLKMESPPLSHQCPIGRSRAVFCPWCPPSFCHYPLWLAEDNHHCPFGLWGAPLTIPEHLLSAHWKRRSRQPLLAP